jgi:DNA invertase Pin-like site-specific DNA recombinase
MLDEFNALGVLFISVGDQIDMSTASGRLMLHLLGAFSEFERALIRERTMRGIDHARREGKKLGRPKLRDDNVIQSLRSKGLSMRNIAAMLQTSLGSVQRALR